MSGTLPLPSELFDKPDLYMVEFHAGTANFANMTRESYFRSIFTDRPRILTATAGKVVLDVEELMKAREALNTKIQRINFIFHTANCGSTLLSRALDLPGRTIGYREPFALRQLGVEGARIDCKVKDPGWVRRLELVLTLLGRRYSREEVPVVKANIPVNFILTQLLSLVPDFRAIFLYSKLESFLISALKLPQRRRWVTAVSKELVGGIRAIEALSDFAPENLSVPEIAATLWIAQMVRLHELLARFEGLSTLESGRFYEHTEEALLHSARLFDINLSENEISAITNGELFSRYSKNTSIQYNAQLRETIRARALAEFGAEVEEGMDWGMTLMEKCGISHTVPNSLF